MEDLKYILQAEYIPWNKLKNKTVLISGAAGFLPAYMVETLLKLNAVYGYNIKVIGLVRNIEKAKNRFRIYANNEHLQLFRQDVCKDIELDEKINFIIHAASHASPKFYGIDPVGTLSSNIIGTKNLLEVACKNNIEGFLYFSSGEVYGSVSSNNIPTVETQYGYIDPLQVRSCYAESKRMGENICISYMKQYGIPVKIIRPFHTYGPGMQLSDGRVFADFVADILNNRNIVVNSDGSARRAFCYLADAIRGFFTVFLVGQFGEAYNVGYPKETSILELANILVTLVPEKKLVVKCQKRSKSDQYVSSPISRNCPDIKKISSLGWYPEKGIEEGFKRTIASFL